MKFLVTGGSGFIGCHLQSRLFASGHSFAVTDLRRILLHRTHGCCWAPIDIRHVHPLVHLLRRRGPFDAIIHLAAMTDPAACEADPETCHAINVQGTRNVITAAQRTKTPRIIFASSMAVCGDVEGTSQYARAKLQCEADLLASGLSVCILRLPRVVAGGDSPSLTLPAEDCVRVGEVCELIRKVAENPAIAGVYNVSGETGALEEV